MWIAVGIIGPYIMKSNVLLTVILYEAVRCGASQTFLLKSFLLDKK